MRIATLNTALVRVEFFGLDVREAIPARKERLAALPNLLRQADHDIVCLQEVYSRSQQRWLANALRGSPWHVLSSTAAALPGQRNWGLVTLVRRELFTITASRYIDFAPADWTEVLIGSKGAMAHQLQPMAAIPKATASHVGSAEDSTAKPFWIVNLHATYGGFNREFAGGFATALRTNQLRKVGQVFGDQAALVMGDFNAGPHISQPAYMMLLDDFRMQDLVAPHENPLAFRTWDPSNPLHDSILNRDGVVHDGHHGRLDQIFATQAFLAQFVPRPETAKMIWDQPIIATSLTGPKDWVCPSDHYGLELCVQARRAATKT